MNRKLMVACACVGLSAVAMVGEAVPSEARGSSSTDTSLAGRRVAEIQQKVRAEMPPIATPRPPQVAAVTPKQVAATPSPSVAPAAAEAAPQGSVQERIAAAWPGDDAKVLRVIRCESNFNPNARSSSGKYWGLFQADASFRSTYGWGSGSVEDQVAMGWRGYQARGWSPWPVCGKR